MKKVTKTATTTTPATPAPKPVKKAAAKTTKAALVNPIVAQPVTAAAPAVKLEKSVSTATTIAAQIDIGFGNTLYIRGEGPGLSWEKGVPLDCVADDKWSLVLQGTKKPVVFKFLVNDLTWSGGEDYVAQPGSSVVVTPVF